MTCKLEPISLDDREAVLDIFNFYVKHSFAAFPEESVSYEFFDRLMAVSDGFPRTVARDDQGRVVGFGMLRPHNPMPAFSRVAEITYFIRPEHTGKGIGQSMLAYLVEGGRKRKIASILAGISSRNKRSIEFHRKNGFQECGRFKEIGQKNGQIFDVVWMQRMI